MKPFTPLIAIGLSMGLLLAPAAHAADGYITCQAHSTDKNKVFYTLAFEANKADSDALFEQFVSYLAANGYTSSLYSPDPLPVSGICNWETSAADANAKTEAYKKNLSAKGASTMGVDFTPE